MSYFNKHEKFFDFLIEEIKKNKMNYSNEFSDGRINSIKDEDTARDLIVKIYSKHPYGDYEIDTSVDRKWYDLAFINKNDKNDIIPINIKVSKLGTDNISGKEGIFYALTGKNPDNFNTSSWETFMNNIEKNLDIHLDASKDYYFLVFNKKVENDCYWTSLKCLTELTQNPNNLPFQSNWTLNRVRVKRSNIDAFKFLLSNLQGSHQKRVDISKLVVDHCNEIINKAENDG